MTVWVKMAQNILQSAWSEKKITHLADDELEDSGRPSNTATHRRTFNSTDENFYNSAHLNDVGLVPNISFPDENTFQKRNRNSRFISTDEVEYETPNLTLKHTPSSDTLYSRGSRNLSRHSPPGSYRNLRSPTTLGSFGKRDKDGINIIMLVGFAIGIACGIIFNILEVYLKWFQLKVSELQLRCFQGRTIQDFYVQEQSVAKKCIYGPLSGLVLLIQSVIYVVLIGIDFLKKPAPKTLVTNVMLRYIND